MINDGLYAVFIGEQHVLTKEIKDGKGKNYYPCNMVVPFGDFVIKQEKGKIKFDYKYFPFYDLLQPMRGTEDAYRGEMYVYGKKWFSFILYRMGDE